eukprot:scaffold2518_cov178-Amphora_coffeaeformis.AAC.12
MPIYSYNALVAFLLLLVLPAQASVSANSSPRSWRPLGVANVAMDGTSRLLNMRGGEIVHVSPSRYIIVLLNPSSSCDPKKPFLGKCDRFEKRYCGKNDGTILWLPYNTRREHLHSTKFFCVVDDAESVPPCLLCYRALPRGEATSDVLSDQRGIDRPHSWKVAVLENDDGCGVKVLHFCRHVIAHCHRSYL